MPLLTQTTEFSQFFQLPPELRLKIWKLSLPGLRILPIRCGANSPSLYEPAAPLASHPNTNSNKTVTTSCTTTATTPASLHVCVESRAETLKAYFPFFGFARSPGRVIFNPASDVPYFGPREGFMAANAQFHTYISLCDPDELATVRRIAISDALFWVDNVYRSMTAASLTVEVVKQLCRHMPGLQQVIFVLRDEDSAGGPGERQLVQQRITLQVFAAFQTVCQDYPDWRPPVCEIASLEELYSAVG